jgi:hypothetical protein
MVSTYDCPNCEKLVINTGSLAADELCHCSSGTKRVVILGLYSKNSDGTVADICTVLRYIHDAIRLSTELIRNGLAPYCPWLDFQYFIMDPDIDLKDVHNTDLAWIDVCDWILIKDPEDQIPPNSQVWVEVERAESQGKPIFYNIEALLDVWNSLKESKKGK